MWKYPLFCGQATKTKDTGIDPIHHGALPEL
jgi:hypothetical protein